jgi:hypothetical protein
MNVIANANAIHKPSTMPEITRTTRKGVMELLSDGMTEFSKLAELPRKFLMKERPH